jgi:rfaE bifunctional protein kinase chain/domain
MSGFSKTMTDLRWLHELMTRGGSIRILVVGDLMLDEFIWGKVSRISPEAPVPIVEVSAQSYYPGGAANVARNLREFTRHVSVMGVIGCDPAAENLLGLLTKNGIDTGGIQQLPSYQTIVKTRIIARQQHVVRVDRESAAGPDPACHAGAIAHFQSMLPDIDAIIIEDYAKGFLNQAFVDEITRLARAAGKIVSVDPNPRNDVRWHGVTAVKPNRAEAFHAAGLPLSEPKGPAAAEDAALLAAGERLLAKWEPEMLLITLGEQGMLLLRPGQAPCTLAPCTREVFDLSGAGDTAIALFTLALAAGSPPEQAAEVANHAASVVVGKLGTAILTPEELLASFEQTGH